MTPRRLLAALVTALVLGVAAPAQATFLVRSDGAGLFVQDLNGLNDILGIQVTTKNGQVAHKLVNSNPFEAFSYDFRTGCADGGNRVAICDRNGPVVNFVMGAGNDDLYAGFGQSGTYGANMGSGDDEFTGNIGTDNADGLSGRDVLSGITGNDDLDGGTGDDRIVGGDGADDLSGDADDDRVGGDAGNDAVAGGTGADFLVGGLGVDSVSGSDGNDSLYVREPVGTVAQADTANCGNGTDFVEADLKDIISSSCNNRDISAVNETPLVRIGRGTLVVRRSRRVRVRLRCPRGVGSLGCKGRLSLRLNVRGSRRARKRYGIGAGRSKTVTVRLSRGSARTLLRRRRQGRRTLGVLSSVESGRLGRKTRVRYPRLRLSRR